MKSTLDAIYESNCLVATNFRDGKYGVHFIFPIKVTEAEASTMLQKILDKYPGTKIKQPLRTIYSLKSHRTKDVYTPWDDPTAKRDAETLVKYSILSPDIKIIPGLFVLGEGVGKTLVSTTEIIVSSGNSSLLNNVLFFSLNRL
jgi:hypothetical protein